LRLLGVFKPDSIATSICLPDFLLNEQLMSYISFLDVVAWNEKAVGNQISGELAIIKAFVSTVFFTALTMSDIG
jgi:hypothetical protein